MPLTTVSPGMLDTTAQYYSFKNRIINGAMVIDQRNNGASVTLTGDRYMLDRWLYGISQSSKLSSQQNAGSVTPPAGFINYIGTTSLSSYSSLATDQFFIAQGIEGLNVADLGWGGSSAETVALSFWVRSSLTGTFAGTLGNNAFNRTYVFTFTISAANTWQYKTVTIPGPTSGTWDTNTSAGIWLTIDLGSGSNYATASTNSWQSSGLRTATGATSVVGTNGATFYITGVQLEKGSTATSFDYRPYGTELQLCLRYCEVLSVTGPSNNISIGGIYPTGGSTTDSATQTFWQVQKRVAPTLTFSAANTWGVHSPGVLRNQVSAISTTSSNIFGALLIVSANVGVAEARPVFLEGNTGQTGVITASAEL